MENIGAKKMMEELRRSNPQAQFEYMDAWCEPFIFGTIPAEDLVLPNGYYYNQKNGINNKHHTESGLYECFMYECDAARFTKATEPKKSLFARIFAR